MPLFPHVRTLLRVAIGAAPLGFVLAACQGPDAFYWGEAAGFGGNSVPGAAGSNATGVAGTLGSGSAGSIMSGTGGSIGSGSAGSVLTGTAGNAAAGSGGGAGGPGTAGTTGAAGNTGAGGRGGTTGQGTGGSSAGRGGSTGPGTGGAAGGTTGTAGMTGTAGRGGTTGTGGRGGAGGTGTGGASGRGGRGGSTGTGGASGTGGANACPLGGKLDCTTTGSLDITGDGQIVDFSTGQWNPTTAKFCDAHGIDGGLSSYAGTGSTAAAVVDTTAQNLKLNFTITAGQYAGGRVNFDSCVDARAFNSVQFTASVTAGSLNGCAWQVQLQTQDQRPTTATNPTGGTCNATTTTCERYPSASLTAATATATMYTTRFTAFSNPANSAIATPSQITGLQWQVNSNNGTGTCTVELHIDNVKFVTQ